MMEEAPSVDNSKKVESAGGNGTSEPGSKETLLDKTRFPPPATWYRTNATAARDDMWAYLSGQTIVLVKPKLIYTLLLPVGENIKNGNDQSSFNESPSNKDDDIWPTFNLFGYQKENYACLKFCQSPWDLLPVKSSPLVTGCKDGFIRIWNVVTGKCVMFHDLHKDTKEVAISCLDWSVRNPLLIYSMDEDGNLVSWYLPKSKLRKFSFGKIVPTSLHVSPHEDNIIAFGTKGGVIFIAKTDPEGNGACQIQHKVRHDEEVVATLWCPKLDWKFSMTEACNQEAVLASSIQSTHPATIRLWSRKADDRGIYNVWEKDKAAYSSHRVFRNFSPLAWVIDPNSGLPLLVTSSKHGQIISYSSGIITEDLVHDIHHHSGIFGLVQCGDILWSTSYEPVIVGWNLRTMEVSCVIPTFKGVCAITPSPSVGSLIGFGGVDGCIRVIDFHKNYPRKNSTKEPTLTHRLKSKIMALAWHPTKDNWLGFGTDDGVLGYFEVKKNQKQIMQFHSRVGGTVYAVDWGPSVHMKSDSESLGSEKNETDAPSSICLYACGSNRVFLIHPSSKDNKLVDVSKIINNTNPQAARMGSLGSEAENLTLPSKASDIRWSPGFVMFAVGYNDGRVELYNGPNLQLRCWIKCHARGIQFLNWRLYDFDQQKVNPDHKERWFATASNDATSRLFNLESVFDPKFLSDENQKPKLIITSAATLRSPSAGDRIISTSWSPHDPSLIVTVSYDSTAIVWSIRDATPIARYMGHLHRLVACSFHPTCPNKLITSSDEFMHDGTVHVWDYREHPYSDRHVTSKRFMEEETAPIHIKTKEQKEMHKKEKKGQVELVQEEIAVKPENSTEVKKEATSHLYVTDTSLIVNHVGETAKKERGSARKNRSSKSLLPSTANVFTNSKCSLNYEIQHIVEPASIPADGTANQNGTSLLASTDLAREKSEEINSKKEELSMMHLGLLGDYGQCVDLLKVECKSHAKKGEWEKGCLLASWMGDTEFVEKAVNEGHITETIVYLTKTLSKKLHIRACEMYARKLILEDEICKGATYLLQAGLKEEAIGVLIENKLYRDAIAMMKMCTMKNNPIQKEVIKKWLLQLVQDGNLEVAAKVYCSIGMFEDALCLLEKRDNYNAWKAGMYLADKCGNVSKLELLGLKYIMSCIMKAEYEEAKQELISYANLKWLLPFIAIHEVIFHLSNQLRDASKDPVATENIKTNFNLKEAVQKQVNLSKEDGVKLKETILVSIAQNRVDAEIMLTRNLALGLLDDDKTEKAPAPLPKEEFLKLSVNWLQEKAPFLHTAYTTALNNL